MNKIILKMNEQIGLIKDLRNIDNKIAELGYIMTCYPNKINPSQEEELTELEEKKKEIKSKLTSSPDIQLVKRKMIDLIHQIIHINKNLDFNVGGLRISKRRL